MTPHLISKNLPVSHGFFGSQGGVSTGIYKSLNAGLRSGDEAAHIKENRSRIQTALGAMSLISLHQVHSDRVVIAADAKAGVIGACHAGWRGALSGIVESTVATMCELGATPTNISAVLGPCIGPDNYEVGEDFKAEFCEMEADYARFFHVPEGKKAHFDLPAFILSRLAIMDIQAEWTGHCTYAHPEDYFSYRRNTHQNISGYGRNLSAIVLPGLTNKS